MNADAEKEMKRLYREYEMDRMAVEAGMEWAYKDAAKVCRALQPHPATGIIDWSESHQCAEAIEARWR